MIKTFEEFVNEGLFSRNNYIKHGYGNNESLDSIMFMIVGWDKNEFLLNCKKELHTRKKYHEYETDLSKLTEDISEYLSKYSYQKCKTCKISENIDKKQKGYYLNRVKKCNFSNVKDFKLSFIRKTDDANYNDDIMYYKYLNIIVQFSEKNIYIFTNIDDNFKAALSFCDFKN